MKQHIPFPSLFFGLLLIGIWGCTDETDLPGAGSDNDGRGTITVSVTDDGYLASAEEDTPATRAQDRRRPDRIVCREEQCCHNGL